MLELCGRVAGAAGTGSALMLKKFLSIILLLALIAVIAMVTMFAIYYGWAATIF